MLSCLRPGTRTGSIVVTVNKEAAGTFTPPGPIDVYGYAGTNKVTINGTAGNDAFSIDGLTATLNGFTFHGTDIEGWIVNELGSGCTVTDLGTLKTAPVTIAGGSGTNTLIGPNLATTWNINKADGGNVTTIPGTGTVSFSHIQDLIGGTAIDIFKLGVAGAVGSINGGGGGDWLDYSAFTTTVMVDLTQGSATAVAGGAAGAVHNIQNVRGGKGDDTLIGNGGNILVGGAGKNILSDAYSGSAASGRSLLIGGPGGDTLTAGSAGDILIAGTTNYDNNNTALAKILAEWQTADSYATRFARLQGKQSGGLNGSYKLVWGSTVKEDMTAETLTGGAGWDWFFANYPGTDTVNNFDNPGDEYLDNGN